MNVSSNFLRYAMTAVNLTPKISELEVIDAIGSHYLNYIQHVLLSSDVRRPLETLSFVNKMQIMQGAEARQSSNREPLSSRTGHISSACNNHNGHYIPKYQPQNAGIRVTEITRVIIQKRLCNQYSTGRESQEDSVDSRRRSQLNPAAESYSSEGTVNDLRDGNVR
jgi:hypothetical protein